MTSSFSWILILALASEPVPAGLSPEAGEHNARAMHHYDERDLALAVDEFAAAYAAMPDPRRDRVGREVILGSMHATLLEIYETSQQPAPLCRLQAVLRAHLDGLTGAYPEDPELLEIRNTRVREDAVTRRLAALGSDVCAPKATPPTPRTEPAPVVSDPPPGTPAAAVTGARETPAAAVTGARGPAREVAVPPRQLRIAGGATLGLGVALVGLMTYGLVRGAQRRAPTDAIDAAADGRRLLPPEQADLLQHRGVAQSARQLAIGAGVTAGVLVALGATMFGLARRSSRARQVALTPWWTASGGGLVVEIRAGRGRN